MIQYFSFVFLEFLCLNGSDELHHTDQKQILIAILFPRTFSLPSFLYIDNLKPRSFVIFWFYVVLFNAMFCFDSHQAMHQHGCSGCTNPQIFGISPFAPADFEAFSTPNVNPLILRPRALFYRTDCTRRCKFLTHTLNLMLDIQTFMIRNSFEIKKWGS